jgi:luciferase-like monooxygenase
MATARLSMAECPQLSGMVRRFRGMGKGRKTRRALERGGTGPAQRLNETVARWTGVRITPMFGRWGYFVGDTLFACFPVREKERDLWIRLTADDQRRALADTRVRPHRRFSRKGWIELDVEEIEGMGRAVRWLRRGYLAAGRSVRDDSEGDD